MDSEGNSRTILLALQRWTMGQASCKPLQLPWGRQWRKEEKKPYLCEVGMEAQHAVSWQKEGNRKSPTYQRKCACALASIGKKKRKMRKELKVCLSTSALRMGTDLTEPCGSSAAIAQNSDSVKQKYTLSWGNNYSSHLLNRALGESTFQMGNHFARWLAGPTG